MQKDKTGKQKNKLEWTNNDIQLNKETWGCKN